ncbi:MAG: hydrolase TatD [Gammaproteobacteria bacterium]|nr:hydrolase TatD [Gammaproteobacteria bacterium]|tara:strand:- start:468 stop:1262 length:795 start_codon:yes stop_codon:yes gene_type:complete
MEIKYSLIDIGANLTHPELHKKIETVVDNIRKANIEKVIITSSNIDDTIMALKIIDLYPDLFYTTVGFHPHNAKDCTDTALEHIKKLLHNAHIVAIGECGLDYYREYSPKEKQLYCFEKHLEIASTTTKPLFLHERHAFKDFFNLLNKYVNSLNKYVVHCFTGDKTQLKSYIDIGCYIGITGWITDNSRGQHLQDLIKYIPEDRLMIETDAPYLIPHNINFKHDGINEPAFLTYVAEKISKCLSKDVNYIKDKTTNNAKTFFNI